MQLVGRPELLIATVYLGPDLASLSARADRRAPTKQTMSACNWHPSLACGARLTGSAGCSWTRGPAQGGRAHATTRPAGPPRRLLRPLAETTAGRHLNSPARPVSGQLAVSPGLVAGQRARVGRPIGHSRHEATNLVRPVACARPLAARPAFRCAGRCGWREHFCKNNHASHGLAGGSNWPLSLPN